MDDEWWIDEWWSVTYFIDEEEAGLDFNHTESSVHGWEKVLYHEWTIISYIYIKDNSKFMKIWGGRLCHVLDHITWYSLPMMIIDSYLWPNCVYWTWMFFFNCLNCHPTQTLLSWNGLTPDHYVGCVVQLVTMGLAATLLHIMGRCLIIPCYINIYIHFFHVSIYNSILEWTTITHILSPF